MVVDVIRMIDVIMNICNICMNLMLIISIKISHYGCVWLPVHRVARIQRQRDVVHVFGCLLARANQDALMQNPPPSQAEGERPIPS
jgi:type IV secretory pathway VirB3-like protein